MGLFTSPVVLNNGVAHTFNFRAQLHDVKSIVGEYIEPAALLSQESKLTVKYAVNGVTKRSLLQRTAKLPIVDPAVLKPITVNLSLTNHSEHTAAQIKLELKLLGAAMADPTFYDNFIMGLI